MNLDNTARTDGLFLRGEKCIKSTVRSADRLRESWFAENDYHREQVAMGVPGALERYETFIDHINFVSTQVEARTGVYLEQRQAA